MSGAVDGLGHARYVQVAFDELPRGHQMSQRDILHRRGAGDVGFVGQTGALF